MHEDELGPVEGPLQRAKLHIRGSKRRFRQRKTAAGIATLYDALSSAMQWYLASPERSSKLPLNKDEDILQDRTAYAVLVRAGVLNGRFDFEAFDRLTDQALAGELPGYDHQNLLKGVEAVMVQLGVMPFDEAALPPEDPKTF